MAEINPEKINEDLYVLIKTIFHYERIFNIKFGLKIEEIYVLEFLQTKEVVRVTDISKELKLPMFTISRLVNRLVLNGHITKEQDIADRRNYFLHLTDEGKEILSSIKEYSLERISSNTKYLKEQQVKELFNLADQLHIILGVTEEVFHRSTKIQEQVKAAQLFIDVPVNGLSDLRPFFMNGLIPFENVAAV